LRLEATDKGRPVQGPGPAHRVTADRGEKGEEGAELRFPIGR
jgi:hypothetical protein